MEKDLAPPQLWLIPVPIAEDAWPTVPVYVQQRILSTKRLMAENARSLRRMLKKLDPTARIEEWTILELDKHHPQSTDLSWLAAGFSFGLVSESGCPGIADPGEELVAVAHQRGYRVIPLVGPSSLLLALMASGLHGQHFEFHGYLPAKKDQLTAVILQLVQQLSKADKTHLFIEAPYRNVALFSQLLQQVPPHVRLCLACRLTAADEYIRTLTIKQWKTIPLPDIDKKECLFLLGR